MTIEEIIREMAKNIFDHAVIDMPMAKPVGTFYLHKLLNMVSPEQAKEIAKQLPGITKSAMDKAIERYEAKAI